MAAELNKVKLLPPADPSPIEPEITVNEAEEAAAEAGLSVIRVRKLRGSSKLSKYIEQIGAQRIRRTVLIVAQDHIETGIQQCDDILAKANPDEVGIDVLMEVVRIKQAFTYQLIKTGEAQMKTEEKATSLVATPGRLNIPFPSGSQLAVKTPNES